MAPVRNAGFSLIELLIFISIIVILTSIVLIAVMQARSKAIDARIRNDVAQLRWEAEIVYDSQNASFLNWSVHPSVVNNVSILLSDIDNATGLTNAATVSDTDASTYCVSAPLVTTANRYYCTDHRGVFREVGNPCPVAAPFACP